MSKRSARPNFPDYSFAKAYYEVKRLREDVALLERSLRSGRATVEEKRDSLKPADGARLRH